MDEDPDNRLPTECFVVLSGLPGSGKTTLARRLAPRLGLRVLDKDDELATLFEESGIGDAAWRRQLSRQSDEILREKAFAASGALLVSFWHLPGMRPQSGTPVDWLHALNGPLIHIWCRCSPELAAQRFARRGRHPGHLDQDRSDEETLASFTELARLEPLRLGSHLEVDTTSAPDLDRLVASIRDLLQAGWRRTHRDTDRSRAARDVLEGRSASSPPQDGFDRAPLRPRSQRPDSSGGEGEMTIVPFEPRFESEVVDLIIRIQRDEFGIDITAEQQPDLRSIPSFYQIAGGNFWVAISEECVIGTIALLDIGAGQAALRKMFVQTRFRGPDHGVARELLQTLVSWASRKEIVEIFLGTTPFFHAAHRFYDKHGFTEIAKSGLPDSFPVMEVDKKFYHLALRDLTPS